MKKVVYAYYSKIQKKMIKKNKHNVEISGEKSACAHTHTSAGTAATDRTKGERNTY